MGKRKKISLYDNLEDCFERFWGEDDLDCYIYLNYENGKKKRRTGKWFLKEIRKNLKCWGWYERKTHRIHLWFDKRCSILEFFRLIAHEVAHTTQSKYMSKKLKEIDAGRVSDAAVESLQVAIGIFQEKTNRTVTVKQLMKYCDLHFT